MKTLKTFSQLFEDVDIKSEPLVAGNVYKIYDRKTGNKLYSAAQYEKGKDFKILSVPSKKIVQLEIADIILTKSSDPAAAKK